MSVKGKYLSDFHELLQEFDFNKNRDLNPENIKAGSHKKLWWICKEYKHVFLMDVKSRTMRNNGCNNKICMRKKKSIKKTKSKSYEIGEIFYKNNNKYKNFKCGTRKLCSLENCINVSSGNYCRKHLIRNIGDNEKKCDRCLSIKHKNDFIHENIEYKICYRCVLYRRKYTLGRHHKKRIYILNQKIHKGGQCVDCGNNDLEVLEFDHIRGQKINVIKRIYNKKGLDEEITKTELRCVNCHLKKNKRIENDNNRKIDRYVRARTYVNNIKSNSECSICKWKDINNLQCLQFDHINPQEKQYTISRLVSIGSKIDKIQKEINKCRILCGNCHRKHTLRQFNYPILEIIKNISI